MNAVNDTEVQVDLLEAERFLAFMAEGEPVTFQTFDDDADRKDKTLAAIFHGTLDQHQKRLQAYNARGAGVFWTVNYTDGAGRKEDNVTGVRCIFLDLDGAPLQPVLAAGVEPHAVIKSSRGRWHVYWMVTGCRRDQFKPAQDALAAKFNGDPSVNDLPRVMRVPGFVHHKGEPFVSRIQTLEAFQPYQFDDLVQRLGLSLKAKPPQHIDPDTGEITNKVLPGGRHAHLVKWAAQMNWRGMPAEAVRVAVQIENQRACSPPKSEADIDAMVADIMRRYQEQHGRDNQPHDWPELDPLPEPVEDAPEPFPHQGLGPMLGEASRAIAEGVQAPGSLAGGSVLAAASLVTQMHADILMPHGQRAPLSVFVVTGALSGDRKSATDLAANKPAEEFRKEQARAHAVALEQYEQDRAARKKGDPEVTQPVSRSLTVGKATVEGLHMMLRNQSAIGVFTAEGGELLGGHSLREDRRSAGLAWFLKAWGAETLDTLTRGDGHSILLGRRVAIHAMVQPVLLRGLLADPLAQGQGFLARCLVSEPATLAGTRLFRAGDPAEHTAVKMYHEALRHLLQQQPVVHGLGDGYELQPRLLRLSPEAEALWVEFYNQVETDQAPGKPLQGARAFAGKAAEHAARIAGIIALVTDPKTTNVSLEIMTGAIQVTGFYLTEHVRLTRAGIQDKHLQLLRTLAEWMASQGKVTQKHILQAAPRAVRELKAEGINPLLSELAERGYIRRAGEVWESRP